MADLDKVIRGWERCNECRELPPGLSQAYVDCEYTIGLYCAQSKLINETLKVLKEQKSIVRCKDCTHGERCTNGANLPSVQCFNSDIGEFGFCHDPDWYCADGERKAGENDGNDD